jgi:hypothetical protein
MSLASAGQFFHPYPRVLILMTTDILITIGAAFAARDGERESPIC